MFHKFTNNFFVNYKPLPPFLKINLHILATNFQNTLFTIAEHGSVCTLYLR